MGGLYSMFKKKKKFPKYPKSDYMPDLPRYESQIDKPSMPKLEDDYPDYPRMPEFPKDLPELNIPIRKPDKFELRKPELREPYKPPRYIASSPESIAQESIGPIFVKLEGYKDAVKNFNLIKSKIKEVESILADLSNIKKEEDAILESWNKEVMTIKTKLMEIDHELFEVR